MLKNKIILFLLLTHYHFHLSSGCAGIGFFNASVQLDDNIAGEFERSLSTSETINEAIIVSSELQSYFTTQVVPDPDSGETRVILLTTESFKDILDVRRPDRNIETLRIDVACSSSGIIPYEIILNLRDTNNRSPTFTGPSEVITIQSTWDRTVPINWNKPVIASDNDYESVNVKATFTVKAEIENPPQTLDLFDIEEIILWDQVNPTNPRPTSYDKSLQVKIKPNAVVPLDKRITVVITASDAEAGGDIPFHFPLEVKDANERPQFSKAFYKAGPLSVWPETGDSIPTNVVINDPNPTGSDYTLELDETSPYFQLAPDGSTLSVIDELPDDIGADSNNVILLAVKLSLKDGSQFFSTIAVVLPLPEDVCTTVTPPVTTECPTSTFDPTTDCPISTCNPSTDCPTTTFDPTTDCPTTTTFDPTTDCPTTTTFDPTTDCPTSTFDPTTDCPTTTFDPTTDCPTTTFDPTTDCPISTCNPSTDCPPTDCSTTTTELSTETTSIPTTSTDPTTTACPITCEPCTTTTTTEDPVTTTGDPITTTQCPTTCDPVTDCPTIATTFNPVTDCPTTCNPVTDCPTTCDPVTDCPSSTTTFNPVTDCPSTCNPVTDCPITCEPCQSTISPPAENCTATPEASKDEEGSKTGLYAGIGVTSVVAVGSTLAAIYFFSQMRKAVPSVDTSWSNPDKFTVERKPPRTSFSAPKAMRASIPDIATDNGFANPAFNSGPSDSADLEQVLSHSAPQQAPSDVSPYASASVIEPTEMASSTAANVTTAPAPAPIKSALATPKEIDPDYEALPKPTESKVVSEKPRGVRIADEVEIMNEPDSDGEDDRL